MYVYGISQSRSHDLGCKVRSASNLCVHLQLCTSVIEAAETFICNCCEMDKKAHVQEIGSFRGNRIC